MTLTVRLLIVLLGLLAMVFGPILYFDSCRVWNQLVTTIDDVSFWIDNALIFIIYGLFVGFMTSTFRAFFEQLSQKKYQDWKFVFRCDDQQLEEAIFWRDVERYRDSKAELWKAIKPIIRDNVGSNVNGRMDQAEKNKWLKTGDLYTEKFGKRGALREIVINKQRFEASQKAE